MLKKLILSSSLFDSIFKILKDYIQPILSNLILVSGIYVIESMNAETQLKIILGVIYGVIYILSAGVSRNIYRLNQWWPSDQLMDITFEIFGIIFFVLALAIKTRLMFVVIVFYLVLYLLKDGRRPLVVDVFGDYMKRNERATVMSIESQIRSLLMVILAPVFGFIAHRFSIAVLFFLIGIFILVFNRFVKVKDKL